MAVIMHRKLGAYSSTRHKVNFTYATPRLTSLGTPLTVPASEPADYTWTFTVQESDFPTCDGAGVLFTYPVTLFCSGLNVAGGAQTLNYRVLLNDVSVVTGSQSIPAENYFGYTFANTALGNVTTGDVIKVRLWASSDTYFNCDKYGMQVLAGKIGFVPLGKTAKNVVFSTAYKPAYSGCSQSSASNSYVYSTSKVSDSSIVVPVDMCINSLTHYSSTNRIFRVGLSDVNSVAWSFNSLTLRMAYFCIVPTSVAWEE